MRTIQEILDHVKTTAGIKNDYNLGQKIGVSTNAMFEFRHGKSIPTDDTCIKLANLVRENPEKFVLIAHAERAKKESKEAGILWNGILKKAINFSLIILLLSPTLLISFKSQHILYIMSN